MRRRKEASYCYEKEIWHHFVMKKETIKASFCYEKRNKASFCYVKKKGGIILCKEEIRYHIVM